MGIGVGVAIGACVGVGSAVGAVVDICSGAVVASGSSVGSDPQAIRSNRRLAANTAIVNLRQNIPAEDIYPSSPTCLTGCCDTVFSQTANSKMYSRASRFKPFPGMRDPAHHRAPETPSQRLR